jgi:hypothetical protein
MITQATIGSITFAAGTGFALTGVPGLELPNVRVFSYDLPGENFGLHTNALYGKRSFALQGMVIGESASDFIDKRDGLIEAFDILSGPQVITFTLSNGLTKRITAVLTALDFKPQPGIPVAAPFNGVFEAAFPYLESTETYTTSMGLALPGGGKVPPDTMPAAIGKGAGQSSQITNSGNAPTYPTARITGPVTNPAIHNQSSNEQLRFALTLASGQYLDIDYKRKTVIDHTGRNRYSTLAGDWSSLPPGTSVMKLLADSTDPNAQLSISYRDAFLNL